MAGLLPQAMFNNSCKRALSGTPRNEGGGFLPVQGMLAGLIWNLVLMADDCFDHSVSSFSTIFFACGVEEQAKLLPELTMNAQWHIVAMTIKWRMTGVCHTGEPEKVLNISSTYRAGTTVYGSCNREDLKIP
jgi:hypothetical protein